MLNIQCEKTVEFLFNNFAHKTNFYNPNWQLNPDELKNVSIRRTNKYEWDEAETWVEMLFYSFRKLVKVEIVGEPQVYK
ncbi:MAG: hypothetical protein K1X72_03525 [Pyrinomonadaceae bacterium]|nr:hypothetical protein [Pyrinomonadaceae bacterium]